MSSCSLYFLSHIWFSRRCALLLPNILIFFVVCGLAIFHIYSTWNSVRACLGRGVENKLTWFPGVWNGESVILPFCRRVELEPS